MTDPEKSNRPSRDDGPAKAEPSAADIESPATDDDDSRTATGVAFDKVAQSVVDASVAVRLEAILSGHLKALDALFEPPTSGRSAVETVELARPVEPVDPYAPTRSRGWAKPADYAAADEPAAIPPIVAARRAGRSGTDFYRLLAGDGGDPGGDNQEPVRPVPHVLEDPDEPFEPWLDVPPRAWLGDDAGLRRRAAGIGYWGRYAREGGARLIKSAPRPMVLVAPLLIAGVGAMLLVAMPEGEMPSAPGPGAIDQNRSSAFDGLLATRMPAPGEQAPGPLLPRPERRTVEVDLSKVLADRAPAEANAPKPTVSTAPPPGDERPVVAEFAPRLSQPEAAPTAVAAQDTDLPELRPSLAQAETAAIESPVDGARPAEPETVAAETDPAGSPVAESAMASERPDFARETPSMSPLQSPDGALAYGPNGDLLANEIAEAVLADGGTDADTVGEETVAAVPSEPAPAEPQVLRQPASPLPQITAGAAATNAFVNMRAGPDNEAAAIRVVPAGALVRVVGCELWCEVTYEGQRGFIYPRFLAQQR
jgi:hypothetical protein